jgi:hypothetical protein
MGGFISPLSGAQEITAARAADLRFARQDVAARFQKGSEKTAKLSYGSLGSSFRQIQNGAPFDLFFSANLDYPKKPKAARLTEPGSFYQYARGKIVKAGGATVLVIRQELESGSRNCVTADRGVSPGPVSAKSIFSELTSNSNQAVPVWASEALPLISIRLDGGRETKPSAITFLSLSSLTVTARNLGSDPV